MPTSAQGGATNELSACPCLADTVQLPPYGLQLYGAVSIILITAFTSAIPVAAISFITLDLVQNRVNPVRQGLAAVLRNQMRLLPFTG